MHIKLSGTWDNGCDIYFVAEYLHVLGEKNVWDIFLKNKKAVC